MPAPMRVVFVAVWARSFSVLAIECGKGVGDLTSDMIHVRACKACLGELARLSYDPGAGDSGYTSCELAQPGECFRAALLQDGDATADASAIAVCKLCLGEHASLQFVPPPFVPGGEDNMDIGSTLCVTPSTLDGSPALRPECGEGVGGARGEVGRAELCRKCEGQEAHLAPVLVRGSLRTICVPRRPLQGEAVADIDAPSDRGDEEWRLQHADFCQRSRRGEGPGDRTRDAAAAEACARCRGGVARLQFFPGGGRYGQGFTYCRIPNAEAASRTTDLLV
mmetsp:Transcript_37574/g.108017  ORF Transcript_37574/g.108017 Transcript_37574/m.108017 type:complete len:280 (+) Transcript_37574:52-891(+)